MKLGIKKSTKQRVVCKQVWSSRTFEIRYKNIFFSSLHLLPAIENYQRYGLFKWRRTGNLF